MRRPFFSFAIILVITILAFRLFFSSAELPPGHILHLLSTSSQTVAVKGDVISDPLQRYSYSRETQSFIVAPTLVKLRRDWMPVHGNIRVTSYADRRVQYGDEILFEGRLRLPPSGEDRGFDYRRYLQRLNVYALATVSAKDPLLILGSSAKVSRLKRVLYETKGVLRSSIERLFETPQRYFLLATLLGERQHIPNEWRDFFIKTQTMHLLAISGMHVGIIGFIIFFATGLLAFPRNARYLVTIAFLIAYAIMVGGRPSVIRATIMATVFLMSFVVKRDVDMYNSLGLAASVILLYNPEELFDYGFILSFISVLSILYITPLLKRLFHLDRIKTKEGWWGRAPLYFFNLTAASCAVWIGLLPLSISFFRILSPISIFVNILAIPMLFIVMSLSFFSVVLYFFVPIIGLFFAEAAQFFIDILLPILRYSATLPFAYFETAPLSIASVFLYYIILVIWAEVSKYVLSRGVSSDRKTGMIYRLCGM